ncbi:unnamed protein product [Linum trigynum]|uniref:Uncharacterized protein n=1 Tax=Linum trigynum TaxID=586398 RepID=A0AAV2CLD7_9ROSI
MKLLSSLSINLPLQVKNFQYNSCCAFAWRRGLAEERDRQGSCHRIIAGEVGEAGPLLFDRGETQMATADARSLVDVTSSHLISSYHPVLSTRVGGEEKPASGDIVELL